MNTKLFFGICYFVFGIFFVQAQIVNIPDANFKNALVNTNCVDTNGDGFGDDDVDTNNDGEIQMAEAKLVEVLIVDNKSIENLTGIEAFTNINFLDCSFNSLETLSLSSNILLRFLNASYNLLEEISLSNNTELSFLDLENNNLNLINVENNIGLESFDFRNNFMTSIDITNNSNLEYLYCSYNQLSSLNVESNKNLKFLACRDNFLEELEFQSNPNLEFLSCGYNNLQNLNVNNNNNIILGTMAAIENPNLTCIQVDDVDFANNQTNWLKDEAASYSKFCELGIQESSETEVVLYPNPTKNLLILQTEFLIEKAVIYNLQGISVKEFNNTKTLEVSELSQGLYFVEIHSEEKKQIQKFIKI